MPSYEQPQANEWVQPVVKDYKMACCDCGLVHNLDFRIHEGRVQFRARRNNRSTAMLRRRHKRELDEAKKRIADLEAAFEGLRKYTSKLMEQITPPPSEVSGE
jgi:hypothetical protein